MDPSSTFLFEVVFRDIPVIGGPHDSPVSDRSVIVEVEPDSTVKTATYLPSGGAAREYAKELAPQVALQVVQKDFPHGFEPPHSIMEIDALPRQLHDCLPNFHGNCFRAWLLAY